MKNLTKSLLAAAVLAASAAAQAAPVTTWAVTVTGIWSDYAPDVTGIAVTEGGTLLSWGTPSVITPTGQSSLKITNPATTSIDTYFGSGEPPPEFIAPSIQLTHNNQPITEPFLTSAEVTVGITLTPESPPAEGFPLTDIAYNIKFKETPNNVPLSECAVVGSPTPCDDIFVLLGGFLNETFEYDGFTYFVNAFPTEGGSLNILDPDVCLAADEAPGCFGFTTPELQSTSLAFGLTISSLPLEVPEPGSLALLGLGLAGLAAATRRKQKQA